MSKVMEFNCAAPRAQRGAVSLVVVLVLLFGITVTAFFSNRSFIFEQRTSANQYRATKAFELAEAGAEWAVGKLNEGLPLAAAPACTTTTVVGAASFRDRYATPAPANPPAQPTGWLNVNAVNFPACRFDAAGVPTCSCPTDGVVPNLGAAEQPRFGVRFASVAGDPAAVEIIARGCTNGVSCDPAAGAAGGDATAIVRVVVKIVPIITTGPAAALTTGAATVTGGNLNVINTNVPSNGITIHAGTTVTTGTGTNVTTIFGTPPRASVLDNDPGLNALSALGEDAFFNAYFGETLTHYINDNSDVRTFTGCSAPSNPCAAAIVAYINTGVQFPRIYADGNVTFTNGTPGLGASLGTANNPVIIVSAGNIELGSNLTAYGFFYAATGSSNDWDYSGSGTATVVGAFVTRGNFNKGAGTLNLVYDPNLWGAGGAPRGRLVRVPGSWRDKATDF